VQHVPPGGNFDDFAGARAFINKLLQRGNLEGRFVAWSHEKPSSIIGSNAAIIHILQRVVNNDLTLRRLAVLTGKTARREEINN
jgi:hypothetical protein